MTDTNFKGICINKHMEHELVIPEKMQADGMAKVDRLLLTGKF